jgi:hypothetical protein
MKRKVKKRIQRRLQRKVFDFAHPVDLNKVVLQIKKNKRAIQALRAFHLAYDPDRRSGSETYGYSSLKSIESNLEYICDRWGCAFRLTWLLGVPEAVSNLRQSNSSSK